jgi:hypothetical protein
VERREGLRAEPEVVAFFESPAGLRLLHRLVLAALVVMTLQGNCGLRLVGQFLQLAGLGPFVACSYGVLQRRSKHLQGLVATFGQEQRAVGGKGMPHKRIVACEDETFSKSGITLVALEPVSGFLLAEEHQPDRTAKTWNGVLERACEGLNVEVVSQASDEAKALQAHAKDQGIPHNPDLFHGQRDVNRTLVLPLARLHRAAVEAGDEQQIEQVERWQESRAGEIWAVGQLYHPYDLETGEARTPEQCAASLEEAFGGLQELAEEVGVTDKAQEHLAKARRVLPSMVAQVGWSHRVVAAAVEEAEFSEEVASHIQHILLPVAYLRRVAQSASTPLERQQLLDVAARLESEAAAPTEDLSAAEQARVQRVVAECAGWFCRGSSCVEGRNGVLALRHHAHHRLSTDKLAALTVAHNFLIRRPDGTTAAQRFFEQDHPDLFEWLLDRFPPPSRPAKSRTQGVHNRPTLE